MAQKKEIICGYFYTFGFSEMSTLSKYTYKMRLKCSVGCTHGCMQTRSCFMIIGSMNDFQ